MKRESLPAWRAVLLVGIVTSGVGIATLIVERLIAFEVQFGFGYVGAGPTWFAEPVFVGTRLMLVGVTATLLGTALIAAWLGQRLSSARTER